MAEGPKFATIGEVIAAAKTQIDQTRWDWISGGAESELTLQRNRDAFARRAFLPRVLRDVHARELGTEVLGQAYKLPLMLAPIGFQADFVDGGPPSVARVASDAGVGVCMGVLSTPDLPAVSQATTHKPWLQLYVAPGRSWVEAKVKEAEAAGYGAVALTADTPVYGRRERDLVNRMQMPGPPPDFKPEVNPFVEQASMTWEYVEWLQGISSLPVVVKGIRHPADAKLALEHGAAGIWLSNHGARQLDHELASLDLLSEVVDAVQGRAPVIFDGGIQRGTDIIKAMALGADLVAIGKLQFWALVADGAPGLARVLELLAEEVSVNLANVGATTLTDLDADLLRELPYGASLPVAVP